MSTLTKFLLTLCLLILAALIVFQQYKHKLQVEELNQQVITMQTEKNLLAARDSAWQDSIQALTSSVISLKEQLKAKDVELEKIQPELARMIGRDAELNLVNNELQLQLDANAAAIRKLQDALELQVKESHPKP